MLKPGVSIKATSIAAATLAFTKVVGDPDDVAYAMLESPCREMSGLGLKPKEQMKLAPKNKDLVWRMQPRKRTPRELEVGNQRG